MPNINDPKTFTSLKTLTKANGNSVLLSNGISSLNFDGNIPKSCTIKPVSDIIVGDIISDSDISISEKTYLVTRVFTETHTISGTDTIIYFIYYLSDQDGEKQFTYSSPYTDTTQAYYGGFLETNTLFVTSDDLFNIDLGDNGWLISNSGNAIFANGFFRGRIEATEGIFSGTVTAGTKDSSIKIGRNLFSSAPFQDTDSAGSTVIASGTETHGLVIDNNNYFFTFNGLSEQTINKVKIINDSDITEYDYFVEFEYETPSFSFNSINSIDQYSNLLISGLVDTDESQYGLASLNGYFNPVSSSTNKFKIKISSQITQYGTNYPITINDSRVTAAKAYNSTFSDDLSIKSVTLTKEIALDKEQVQQIIQKSIVKIYTDTSAYTNGDYIKMTGFTSSGGVDLTSLNNSYLISTPASDVDGNYLPIQVDRITAGTYTSNLGKIQASGQVSKFKVGSSSNFMKYDSGLDQLTVTGTINATGGYFGQGTNIWSIGSSGVSFSNVTNNKLVKYDPSFEDSDPAVYWKASGSGASAYGVTQSNTTSNIGSYSMAVTASVSSPGSVNSIKSSFYKIASSSTRITLTDLGASVGNYLIFGGYVRKESGLNVNLRPEIQFYNSSGVQIGGTVSANYNSLTNTFTKYEINGTIPANTASVLVYFVTDGNAISLSPGTTNIYYVDDVYLQISSTSSSSTNTKDVQIKLNSSASDNYDIQIYSPALTQNIFAVTSPGMNGQAFGRVDVSKLNIINGTTRVFPILDNTYSLGTGNNRWTQVYAAASTISTSDIREKNTINDSDLGLDFINSLRPVSFKFNNSGNEDLSSGKRKHYGLIAQEVKSSFESFVEDFGGWILIDKNNEDSLQGLRYEEFISPIIKSIQELSAKIDYLENRIALLEDK